MKNKALIALQEAPIVASERESLYSYLMILVYEGRAIVSETLNGAAVFEAVK